MFRRVLIFVFLVFLIPVLATCSRAAQRPTPENQVISTTPGLAPEYETDPATQVIFIDWRDVSAWQIRGSMCNHIPILSVWGDGRTLYSGFRTGTRVVEAGTLDSTQIHALIQTIAGAGFFTETPKETEIINPAGDYFYLTVNLITGTFSTDSVGWSKITPDIDAAIDTMGLPAYTPERGLLISTPCSQTYCPSIDQIPAWPDGTGISLADAQKGVWITGDVLSTIWQAENASWIPVFRDGNVIYGLALEIPGISYLEPPFNCWGDVKRITP